MSLALLQILKGLPEARLINAYARRGEIYVYFTVQPSNSSARPFKLMGRVTALDGDGHPPEMIGVKFRSAVAGELLTGEFNVKTCTEGYLNCDDPSVTMLGLPRGVRDALYAVHLFRWSDFAHLADVDLCRRLAETASDNPDDVSAAIERAITRFLMLRRRLELLGYSLSGNNRTREQLLAALT